MKTQEKSKLDKKTKKTLKRLDQLQKKNEILFKEDKVMLKELRRIVNAQQRKAS